MADGTARGGRRGGPAGFLLDLFSQEPAVPPPPPPAGMGEAVASFAATRSAFRRSQLKLLAVILALAALVGSRFWPWDLTDWLILLGMSLPCWLLLTVGDRPPAISVGENWLRVAPEPPGQEGPVWVRTDQLTRIDQEMRFIRPVLVLHDRQGRVVKVELAELKANPAVFEVFCQAARRSYENGLQARPRPGIIQALELED